MIVFYNQTNAVTVNVPCMTEEFENADYQNLICHWDNIWTVLN